MKLSFLFVNSIMHADIIWHGTTFALFTYQDQWISSKPSKESPEVKPSGMTSSVSAPSRLPSVKTPQKDGLFDDDDDLFAATNELRFVDL